jgi:hypothetical protein
MVMEDVSNGLVSRGAAQADYGVVVDIRAPARASGDRAGPDRCHRFTLGD